MLAPPPAAAAEGAVAVVLFDEDGALVTRVLCANGASLDLSVAEAAEAPLELLSWGAVGDALVAARRAAAE